MVPLHFDLHWDKRVTSAEVLQLTDRGLYCPAGDFYIDPWQDVDRAIITHAHADHARPGSRHYLTSGTGESILRLRMGAEASIQALDYGETALLGEARVSLHPAGHILGSSQVRIEHRGEVWGVSGDYKREADPTCTPFEPVRCHTFVTESTFGLPIYRWPVEGAVAADINEWWRENQTAGRPSLLFAYALGKAQRVLAQVDASIGPIFTHGAVERVNAAYRAGGIRLAPTQATAEILARKRTGPWEGALIVAPPSARGTPWVRRFPSASTGFVSGWMQIRGTRRRRAIDRGFVLSDHADWPSLLGAIESTRADTVWVTHGYSEVLVRWLRERGLDARAVPTRFEGERDDVAGEIPAEEEAV
jgi:putative mRNA 3-end processing factor